MKFSFIYGLLSIFIFNVRAFQLPTNEDKPSKWIASSVRRQDGSTIYYAKSDLPMTYDDAHEYCIAEKGYLAEPRSSEETEEINKLFSGNNLWIGLTDRDIEGLFLWDSDGQNTESYHNWGGNEPTNDGDCAMIANFLDQQWNDSICEEFGDWWTGPIYALCQQE